MVFFHKLFALKVLCSFCFFENWVCFAFFCKFFTGFSLILPKITKKLCLVEFFEMMVIGRSPVPIDRRFELFISLILIHYLGNIIPQKA